MAGNKEQEQEVIALECAGFWRRLGAYLIDSAILSSPAWFSLSSWKFGILYFWSIEEWVEVPEYLAFPPFFVSDALPLIIGTAYFIVFWIWRGQTLGMMVLNISIIRRNGTNIYWWQALLRYIGFIVSIATAGLGFLLIVFGRRKQGLHDKIADTYVVIVPKPRKTETVVPQPGTSGCA
jgi:uncharacterized RDD family membrane protein YckC